MPPDPKTPEERLSEARKAVYYTVNDLYHAQAATKDVMKDVDRLATLAVLVGRIQQHQGECIHPTPCALRDRLLAELEKHGL